MTHGREFKNFNFEISDLRSMDFEACSMKNNIERT